MYVEKHHVVKYDILQLQEFFEGCDDTAVHSCEYKRVNEAKEKAMGDTKAKKGTRHNS